MHSKIAVMLWVLVSIHLHIFSATACERVLPSDEWRGHVDVTAFTAVSRAAFPPALSSNENILSTSFTAKSVTEWSHYYTHGDHVAGRNKSMAEWTAQKWSASGFSTSLAEYMVYLNYPVNASLSLLLPDNTTYTSRLYEEQLSQDETTTYPNSIPAFHGYSSSGNATAEYIYVGRGSADDFKRLVQLGVNLRGKIALAKYGGPFRGLKVKNAQAYGMIGCVIFTDPGDDRITEAKGFKAYPEGPARNPSSIQRGSVLFLSTAPGDPTTPGYPSKADSPRQDKYKVVPKIPSLPISYRDAIPLLAALDGYGTPGKNVSRSGWTGGLNVSYSTGPAPNAVLRMSNIMRDATTPIWNVIGIINGTNADETIIIGNHRDAWIIGGAADPNSGSAVMDEIATAFGKLQETGWQPRRNIVLCSWDAEEYGLVGSTEWVEEYIPWLAKTAVSYINLDIAVSGPIPSVAGTPELNTIVTEVMKKVVYPAGGNATLYDAYQDANQFVPEMYRLGVLGSGSDYTSFVQRGIGAVDFASSGGENDPVYHYHSNYDSFHWMNTYGDPGFRYHTAVGQYVALLAYHLADDEIIPFDISSFADALYLRYFVDLVDRINSKPDMVNLQKELNLNAMIDAMKLLQDRAKNITAIHMAQNIAKDQALIAKINGKYRDFQRAFVSQGGLPEREFYRNVLYAPGIDTGYAAVTFPGVTEALNSNNFTLATEWMNKTTAAILAAADILQI